MIYEVLRVYDNRCLFLDEHLSRMRKNLSLVYPDHQLSDNSILEALRRLLRSQYIEQGNLMISLDPSVSNQPEIKQIAHIYPTEDELKNGVAVISLRVTRTNPTIKTWNPQVREKANQTIKQNEVYEVLLLNELDEVTEGSRSNLFWVKNQMLYSPPVLEALPGITRQKTIELALQQQLTVKENRISIDDLMRADEVFITGTSPGILPVKEIDGITMTGNLVITRNLQSSYFELVTKNIESNQIL